MLDAKVLDSAYGVHTSVDFGSDEEVATFSAVKDKRCFVSSDLAVTAWDHDTWARFGRGHGCNDVMCVVLM